MSADQPAVPFSQAVYGEEEIDAVTDVLESGKLVSYGRGEHV